ncbi:restriction endonuclease subunit S [Mesonia mobilis]|uniref:restriction endonuclease subunit S n=1 Tax=Mesonia mobilis TaxID=369791 RepID=UPI0026ECFF9C|nr:restriction endonuclease subunit S [Mesonia mobilis]
MIETKEKLVPSLRFPEFNSEWKRNTIAKTFSIFNGYAFSSSDSIKENGVKWVKIADVGVDNMKEDNLSYLPKKFIDSYKKFVLKEGDYVLALTRPILDDRLKIARINDFFHNSLLNQRVGKIVTSHNQDFVFNLLKRRKLVKEIENNIAGSDPPNLSSKEIRNIKVYLPEDKEQQKIASFLSAVDEKINQLQRKKELLQAYKKGMMQQLFSQQLRFKNEDGNDFPEWRKGVIKDFGYFYYGKSAPKFSLSEDAPTPCVRYGELYSTYKEVITEIKSYTNIEPKNLKFSKGGEVLVPRVGEDPLDFANCSYLPLKDVAIGEMISVYNTKENGLYITYYFNASMKRKFGKVVEGGNVSNLYFKYLEDIPVSIPSKEEQTKIASFLSALDAKIDTVSTAIIQTQDFKKGLLQQMFV